MNAKCFNTIVSNIYEELTGDLHGSLFRLCFFAFREMTHANWLLARCVIAHPVNLFYCCIQGSYKCGACNSGYVGNGYSGCTPGDFCNDDSANDCHSNATCTSRGSGRYTCTVRL